MIQLEDIRPAVEHFVTAAAEAFQVEAAVFSEEGKLFFGTPIYLKKKGNAVHRSFIREVMENGSLLVTDPGHMPSCIGCRFNEHCPATSEILCCIHAGTRVAGVVSFTAFNKKGQRQISENTSVYLGSITKLSSLLGGYLSQLSGDSYTADMEGLTEALMSLCGQPLILTDPNGVVLRCNDLAAKALKFCDLTATSLRQIFSEEIASRITQGSDLREKTVSIGKKTVKVSSRAILSDGHISSILVRLSNEFLDASPDFSSYKNLIGESTGLIEVRRIIRRVADSPTPILITGETGTGKELAARSIHEESKRRKYPFIAINCSSVPENLFESELFGYEEGAFTGAKKGGKIGKIEMAQGGTLFLDELGEMPMSVQPKLLRVLQEHELERVGSTKKIHLDIRIVAATNRGLEEMIKKGTFREDLFYRISVINLKLPPLRERSQDILPISLNYITTLRSRMSTPLRKISPETAELLLKYGWPGNIRELQNALEYAANLCEGDTLLPKDLPEHILNALAKPDEDSPAPDAKTEVSPQEKRIMELLGQYGHTLEGKKQVAAALGISLRTLYRKLAKLSL